MAGAAADVVIVMSSESSAYQEALAGFKESFGHPVSVQVLSANATHVPNFAKIIVAFGGKAASYPYAENTTLIYALAPAFFIPPDQHDGPIARIFVVPRPEVLAARLKDVQPSLTRLAVILSTWGPEIVAYCRSLQHAAKAEGFDVQLERIEKTEELPEHLRALEGRVDALFMFPDPALITPSAFNTTKEFGRANHLPLYVPMDNLVDKGATASIAPDFREMGRAAGRVADQALKGEFPSSPTIYAEKNYLTLNLKAAVQSGLVIPPAVVKSADRVVP
jgi:hypothetical protein